MNAAPSPFPVISPSRWPPRPLGDARQDPVPLALRDRLGQVLQPALDHLRQLGRGRVAAEHRRERLGSHVGIRHARVGELADVGRDAVELLERLPPGGRAGPAGRDERAVDVEEEDAVGAGHGMEGARFAGMNPPRCSSILHMQETGIPRPAMAFAVIVLLLVLPGLLGAHGPARPARCGPARPRRRPSSPRSRRAATPCSVAAP